MKLTLTAALSFFFPRRTGRMVLLLFIRTATTQGVGEEENKERRLHVITRKMALEIAWADKHVVPEMSFLSKE